MMKNRIYIIADSFGTFNYSVEPLEGKESTFWIDELSKRLPESDIVVNAHSSRDVQTIIDTWIRTLKYVKERDVFIICIPSFKRVRLPLQENSYIKENFQKYEMYTRFIGAPSYNNKSEYLEFWGNTYDWRHFEYKLEYQQIINASIANQLNTIEMIESLILFSKIKTYIFSWDNLDVESRFIEDRKLLERNIGYWETFTDVYEKTNGKFGIKGDCHWSHDMNLSFAKYVYNKLFL